ncbi:MAG TPA: SCO family protein [Candidatus Nanopelagicales bacterium]
MGSMAPGGNTALAGALYSALLWQLALLVAVSAVVTSVVLLRRGVQRSSAPTVPEPRGRRVLRISLGALWVVDGLLQAQPAMPASFVPETIAPSLSSAPDWLFAVVDPLGRLWLQHPVAADAVTVWVQVGLGIAILVGGTGRLARSVLLASAAWAAFVWVVGELVGGLTDPQASWLTGAPGAALLYVVASLILLLPAQAWDGGAAGRWARRAVGATFVLGALLQALPRAGFWTPTGLFDVLSSTAAGGVPAPAAAPIQAAATAVPMHAGLANAVLVTVLAVVGTGLVLGVLPRAMTVAGILTCLFGWWFGQGFGVFGGTGTDPNTGLVSILLLLSGWPWPQAATTVVPDQMPIDREAARAGVRPRQTSAAVLALGCLVLLPIVAGIGLLGPATAQAAVGDSGGVVEVAPTPAPDFVLTGQDGRPVAMRDQRGRLTLVVFLDPECFDSCPLMANQLASAVQALGPDADAVSILAVDVNPVFNTVADVATFTREHGLERLPGWHFATGSTAQVGAVLAAFGEGVSVPDVGMIGHPQTVYLFGRDGSELSVLNDTANDDLTESYVALITGELRAHL